MVTHILILIFSGVLQNSGLLNVFGIKPNLLLTALIVLSFFSRTFLRYFVLLIIGVFFSRFMAGPEIEPVALGILSLATFGLRGHLPWLPVVNILALTAVGTVLFYLLTGPSFVYNNLAIAVGEIIYNVVLSALLFLCLKKN